MAEDLKINVFENIEKFIELTKTAKQIQNSESSWETKYDLIFSDNIIGQIRATGIEFEWCDPDSSYQEDVTDFVSAISEKADDLSKILST